MRKILYVGFKGKNNSSYQLVEKICGDKLFLTNSFDGLKRDIENISFDYDVIYMFGLDRNLKDTVRIEKCAEMNNVVVNTQEDLSDFVKLFTKHNIKFSISEKPTHYLCNSAYYHMMNKIKCKAVFFHIPPLRKFSYDLMQKLLNVFAGQIN